ncbi:MAG: exopolysaccharide biosynthesis polyprenyl glycosylphosphotransferase [Rhodospirillaceae bacterium]|nr:exopolysaccharide biosynthesis polyprenyl glycosylphosphotransferase [Rhodospirillaceae bacterium]
MSGTAMLQLHSTPKRRLEPAFSGKTHEPRPLPLNRSRLIPRDPNLGGVLLAICDISVVLSSIAAVASVMTYVDAKLLSTNLPYFFVISLLSVFLGHAFAQSYKGDNLSRISKTTRVKFIVKPTILTGLAILFSCGVSTLLDHGILSVGESLSARDLIPEVCLVALASASVGIERAAIYGFLRRLQASGQLCTNVVLFGADTIGQRLMQVIRDDYADSVQVRGVFDDRVQRVPDQIHGIPVDGGIEHLIALVQNTPTIDKVLVALPMHAEARILHLLHRLQHLLVDVALVPELVGVRIDKQVIRGVHPPILSICRRPLSDIDILIKRCFDFTAALGGLILLAPIFAVAAIAMKIDSPGPIWFRQPRMGFNNNQFDVLKFRSMYVDCADIGARQQTKRNDARVTRVGAWLRRTSVDELPQLLNVLRGDMSLVGPRPHALGMQVGNHLCDEIVRGYAVRHRMKPGITGWAQVRGLRGAIDVPSALEARVQHDIYYIDNWSFFFDIQILILTVVELIRPRNAF